MLDLACMYNSVSQRVANLVQRIQLGYTTPSGMVTVVFLFLALSSIAQVTTVGWNT